MTRVGDQESNPADAALSGQNVVMLKRPVSAEALAKEKKMKKANDGQKATKAERQAEIRAKKEAAKEKKMVKKEAKKQVKAEKKAKRKERIAAVRTRHASVVPVYDINHTGGVFEDRTMGKLMDALTGEGHELTASGATPPPTPQPPSHGHDNTPGHDQLNARIKPRRSVIGSGRHERSGGDIETAAAVGAGGKDLKGRAQETEVFEKARPLTPNEVWQQGLDREAADGTLAVKKKKRFSLYAYLSTWAWDYAKRTYQKRVVGIDVYAGIDYSMYEPFMNDFNYLGLKTRDVVKLLNVFLQVDADRSGYVDDVEFLTFADIERTPFALKIFHIFDNDHSGEVDFVEFVSAIWNFCSMANEEIGSFAFECFGTYNKTTRAYQMNDPKFLMDSIFDKDTRDAKVTQHYFDEIIYRNGHLTYKDWTKWLQHNGRALRPLVALQRKMRMACVTIRFWKKQTKNRKRIFGKLPFLEIEKTINAQRRKMPKRAKRKAIAAPPRTPTAETWEEDVSTVASSVAAWDVKEPPERRKPKKKKFRTVMMHGFEQAVPVESDEEDSPRQDEPDVDAPITIKQKAMLTDKRTRAEAIEVLQSLRNKHARLADQRKRKVRRKARDEKNLDKAWAGAHRGQYEELGSLAAVHGSRAFLAVAKRNAGAARAAARSIATSGPSLSRYPVAKYPCVYEPSHLERSIGIYHLQGMIPTGDEASVSVYTGDTGDGASVSSRTFASAGSELTMLEDVGPSPDYVPKVRKQFRILTPDEHAAEVEEARDRGPLDLEEAGADYWKRPRTPSTPGDSRPGSADSGDRKSVV